MAFSAATSGQSVGENISHCTGVRMRIVGNGDLQMTLFSLDSVESQTLVPFTMTAATNREPFRLANFNQQRQMLKGITTEKDEIFRINRIILFFKPLWTDYPG